jgi:hypothetical protein
LFIPDDEQETSYFAASASDGSLSVYCGRNQIVYVNVETEHGHEEEQYRLTKVVLNLLSRPLINK